MAELVTIEMMKRGRNYCNILLGDTEIKEAIFCQSINPIYVIKHVFVTMGIEFDPMHGTFESEIKLLGNQSLEQIASLKGLAVKGVSKDAIHDIAVEALRLRCSPKIQPYHQTIENLFFEGAIMESDKLAADNVEHAMLPSIGRGYSIRAFRQ